MFFETFISWDLSQHEGVEAQVAANVHSVAWLPWWRMLDRNQKPKNAVDQPNMNASIMRQLHMKVVFDS